MDKTNKLKLEHIIAVLVAVGVVLLLIFIWIGQSGYVFRTGYSISYYEINIYADGSINNTELMFPIMKDDIPIDYSTTLPAIVDTEYGQMMKFMLHDGDNTDILHIAYKLKILGHELSSQDGNSIWVYSNIENTSIPMYFTLTKSDVFGTLSIMDLQYVYEGVLSDTYPQHIAGYNEVDGYTQTLKVELVQGWSPYNLVSGSYTYAVD